MSTVYSVISDGKIETAESYTKKDRAVAVADRRHETNPYVDVVVQTKTGTKVHELEAKPRPVKERKPRKLRQATDAPAIVDGWDVVYTRDNGDTQILRKTGDAEMADVWSWNRKTNSAELVSAPARYAVGCVIHERLMLTNTLYAERVVRPATHCHDCVADRERAAANATPKKDAVAKPAQPATPKATATNAAKPKGGTKAKKKATAAAK